MIRVDGVAAVLADVNSIDRFSQPLFSYNGDNYITL